MTARLPATADDIARAVEAEKLHGVRVELKRYPDGSESVIVEKATEEVDGPDGSYRLG